jgi:YCII-related domain
VLESSPARQPGADAPQSSTRSAFTQEGTVRVRNANTTFTDGPFAETKELLAGFYLIEAKDLNEAIAVAARITPDKHGSIGVRTVDVAGYHSSSPGAASALICTAPPSFSTRQGAAQNRTHQSTIVALLRLEPGTGAPRFASGRCQ